MSPTPVRNTNIKTKITKLLERSLGEAVFETSFFLHLQNSAKAAELVPIWKGICLFCLSAAKANNLNGFEDFSVSQLLERT
jgi:hypothetical protein